jgi:spermidine/putrescine transport system ATP-binding protein
MSNRIAVMRHGKIEQIGPPEEVYEGPATEFVAAFLGASNMIDGEVKGQDDGGTTIMLSNGTLVSAPSERAPFRSGTAVKVGVRPEKISLLAGSDEGPAGVNSVSGLVRMSTYIGVSHQYKIEGPGGVTMTVWVQNLGTGRAPSPGESVRLVWSPEHTFAVLPQEGLVLEEEQQ